VKYWDDVASTSKNARNLAQLSTFYTMKNRLANNGFKLKSAVKDVVMAVKANQPLTMEFEEETSKVKVGA
jgi:hypothetical protein